MDELRLPVVVKLGAAEIERIARRAAQHAALESGKAAVSPYLTVPEAAEYLRCRRQRVDDLLSQGRLTRVKDGRRTLIQRVELEAHLRGEDTGPLAKATGSFGRKNGAQRRLRRVR